MSDIKLDGSIAEFHISEIGKNSGETFTGDFTVKCFLSPIDIIKADKLNRDLLGEISPHLAGQDASNMSFALSQLKYRVVKSPAGWKNTEIDGGHLDINIIIKVLNTAVEAQTLYKKRSEERLISLQNKLTNEIKSGKIKEKTDLEADANEEI
jgi:hypothetical protein